MQGELINLDNDGGTDEDTATSVNGHEAPLNAVDQEESFLSLPAFRMMCLSNPLLDTFFSSQLPASFKLEAPTRGSINGTSIWHDVPSSSSTITTKGSPKLIQGGNTPSSAPAKLTSFSSPSSPPSTARAYSKDVSTGMVGRLGGLLNTFLGEEVKSKVDELADSLGEKLNTKVVKGPLPSFAYVEEDASTNLFGGTLANKNKNKKKSSGTLGMDDLSALEEERREKRRRRQLEEEEEEEEQQQAKALASDRKGIDINAAQRSLRMATESIVEGIQTGGKQFRDDLPVLAQGEEEEEEEVVVVDDDVVHLSQ